MFLNVLHLCPHSPKCQQAVTAPFVYLPYAYARQVHIGQYGFITDQFGDGGTTHTINMANF